MPFPEKAMDAYNESKAKAEEMVLAANGEEGLLTVALRPAGIFGSVSKSPFSETNNVDGGSDPGYAYFSI